MKGATLKFLRYFLLIIIVGFAIWRLFPHFKDFHKIIDLKDRMHYGWILAAIVSQLFQYAGDGWVSKILLQVLGIKVRMKDSIRIASLNVFAAHILPLGEAGGLALAYHFYRKLGVKPEEFIFLTIGWSIVTNLLLFFLLIVPLFFLPYKPIHINAKLIFIAAAIVLILITTYLYRKTIYVKLESLLGKFGWFKHFSLFVHHKQRYKNLLLNQPGMIIKAFTGGLIYYFSNIATLFFSFLAFGTMPSLPVIVFAYSASLLLGRITLAPAGVGTAEATLILIFLESGVDPNIALASTVIYRIISFWLPIPGGFFSFYSLRKNVKSSHAGKILSIRDELQAEILQAENG